MTNIFKLSLIAVCGGMVLAGAAQAQEVRVSIVGKTPRIVHAEFIRAALKVCAGENTEVTDSIDSDHTACMRATVAKADTDYRQLKSQTKSQQFAMIGGQ